MAIKKPTGGLKIDSQVWNMDFFSNVTEERALEVHKNTKFSSSTIKKVWKIANGLTVPNYLKEQIEAEKEAEKPTTKPKSKSKKKSS